MLFLKRANRLPLFFFVAFVVTCFFFIPKTLAEPPNIATVRIEFFFTAGCEECRTVREEILPATLDVFRESISFVELDLAVATNYARLAFYQDRLEPEGNESLSIVLNGRVFLGGVQAIKTRLYDEVEKLALETADPDESESGEIALGHAALENRFRSWNVWTIAGVGLADGLNPCAFATLIFFMTMLISARQTRDKLLVVGFGFCLAVFLTYLGLGFGAFHALRALSAYSAVSLWLRRVMVVLLILLALLSFRDAWVYWRRGKPAEVVLQLPDRVKLRIHDVMRSALTAPRLFLAGMGIGSAVTLLESVCTGQMYLPTLAYMAGHPELKARAWSLLLLYNAMFVAPQAAVFAAVYHGASGKRAQGWSKAHLAPAKVLLGVVFALLAGLLAWL